jgi:hypothetical protein
MNRIIAGLALACAAAPAAASEPVAMRFDCRDTGAKQVQARELEGLWDLLMDVGGTPSFGLLSVGMSGPQLAGSVAMNAGVAVVRSLALDGTNLRMVVVTSEGDVTFVGTLVAEGKQMCGIVTYHGGQKLPMVARKKPGREIRPAQQAAAASQGR